MAITLTVNGATPHTPRHRTRNALLWALREQLGLTGTKFGCGIAACSACTVHLDGRAVRSCTLPSSAADGKSVTTIEDLPRTARCTACSRHGSTIRCHSAATASRSHRWRWPASSTQSSTPTDDEVDAAITNICRCGTFARVRRAIHDLHEDRRTTA